MEVVGPFRMSLIGKWNSLAYIGTDIWKGYLEMDWALALRTTFTGMVTPDRNREDKLLSGIMVDF